MGVERMMEITQELIKHGASADTPVALVRWATRGNQQTLVGTLGTIAEQVKASGFKAPAVRAIGDVVKEREQHQLVRVPPLFGRSALSSPRTRHQAGGLTKQAEQARRAM